jgi:hypothetical protein
MGDVERIEFGGVTFRRYPEARQHSDRAYFTPGIADRQRGVKRLHEEIWIKANGPIPDDHDIHHIDFDAGNNELGNLRCLPRDEHRVVHVAHRHATGFYTSVERLALLERIRPLAAPWHSTEAGLELHRANGAKVMAARAFEQYVCDRCGAGFESRSAGDVRFCTNACKSAWRRATGVDDVDRSCAGCGEVFRINRYSKAKSCSRACAQRARHGRGAGVQPDGRG